jgi:hypothetical protein
LPPSPSMVSGSLVPVRLLLPLSPMRVAIALFLLLQGGGAREGHTPRKE